jgi:hypothetical protein
MHNALRQISARPFQRLTVGASGSDRPVATGETPCRVAARAGGMPRYFPLTVAASSSRPMNLGGTPRHRSWTRVYVATGGRGTNSRGHPPGRAASTLGVICRCGCRVRCVKGGVSVPAGQDVLYVSLSRVGRGVACTCVGRSVVGGVSDRPTGQCPVLVMCSIAALSSWVTMASSAPSRGGYT